MRRGLVALFATALLVSLAVPAAGITNGQPDNGEHPYVGLVVFDVDGTPSHRCSASLLTPTVVLTAGHCTEGTSAARIWFVEVESGELLTNYKIPRSETGTCTMHNFNFIPLRGRNVLVSAAYTGGTTVVDVDALIAGASEAEAEVGYSRPHGGNAWSTYWYNGFIYANDILRGVDTLLLSDRARAGDRKLPYLNPQTQENVIH